MGFSRRAWRRTFHRLATGSRARMRTRRPKGCNGTHASTLLCGNRSRAWLLGANHRRLARAHGAGRDGALCPCSRFRANCCSGSRLRADCGGPRWFRRGGTGYSIEKEAHAALRRDHTRIRPSWRRCTCSGLTGTAMAKRLRNEDFPRPKRIEDEDWETICKTARIQSGDRDRLRMRVNELVNALEKWMSRDRRLPDRKSDRDQVKEIFSHINAAAALTDKLGP